jgi:hypothetical protein
MKEIKHCILPLCAYHYQIGDGGGGGGHSSAAMKINFDCFRVFQ